MISFTRLISIVHFVGLGLAVGAATVKLVLLVASMRDAALVPVFFKVAKPITRTIVTGIVLLTLSGGAWLLLGYPFTPLLVVKLALVAAVWVLGPVIDNVIEPRFRKAAAVDGPAASPALVQAQKQFLAFESAATLLFYAIIVMWVLR